MGAAFQPSVNIHVLDSSSYTTVTKVLLRATLLITHGTGLHEETHTLGIPIFIPGAAEERTEGLTPSLSDVVVTDGSDLVETVNSILRDGRRGLRSRATQETLGAGRAARRIVAILANSPLSPEYSRS